MRYEYSLILVLVCVYACIYEWLTVYNQSNLTLFSSNQSCSNAANQLSVRLLMMIKTKKKQKKSSDRLHFL